MEISQASYFCGLLFLLLLVKFIFERRTKKLNLPPSPPKLFIIGNLHQITEMSHVSLAKLAAKYGPIMYMWLGQIPTVVVSSDILAKEVMKTHDQVFASRPEFLSSKMLLYDCTDVGFSPSNAHWRFLRKICVTELLSTKRVQSYDSVRVEEVSRLVQKITTSCDGTINLTKMLRLYAYDFLSRVVIGKNFSDRGYDFNKFEAMLGEFTKMLGAFNYRDYFPSFEILDTLTGHKSKLEKAFQPFDKFLNDVIKEHQDSKKEEPRDKDFLDVLLNIYEEGSGDMPLTIDDIKSILVDMFVAGTDSIASTLDWVMTELLLNPGILKQAQAEIRSIVGEGKTISQNDLSQLHYLKAIIKETLRIHPPAPLALPRESVEDVTINGYDIPAKTRVLVNVWAIARDPRLWEDPETFNPNRFINNNIDFSGQNFELLPFGAGRRSCAGMTFANASLELVLAQLLHNFDWELPSGVQAKDLDLSERFNNINVEKRCDLIAVVKPHI